MLIAYKIVLILATFGHIAGAVMGVFMPASTLEQFGLEYSDDLQRIAVHFGLLLMAFSAYLILAVYWTFKGRVEGIQLGVVGGLVMCVAFVLDLIVMGQGPDLPLLIMAVLLALTSFLALRGSSAKDSGASTD